MESGSDLGGANETKEGKTRYILPDGKGQRK